MKPDANPAHWETYSIMPDALLWNLDEAARQLGGISIKTVEAHRANIMEKLSVKNTAELVKIALEKKIV